MTLKTWIIDTAEKAGSTLVQAAIVYAIAAQTIDNEFWRGLLVALVIALANVLKAALTTWMPTPGTFWLDMVVRTVWTFLISLAGSLTSVNALNIIEVSFWKQVVLAALTAALVVFKAGLAKMRTDPIVHETDGESVPVTPASLVTVPEAQAA